MQDDISAKRCAYRRSAHEPSCARAQRHSSSQYTPSGKYSMRKRSFGMPDHQYAESSTFPALDARLIVTMSSRRIPHMVDQHVLIDRYEALMVMSEQAFADRQYEVAYHTLSAAMHCAEALGDERRLRTVEQTARMQRDWINSYDPAHRLSRQSAAARGGRSIYDSLDVHLESIRLRLRRIH